MISKENFIGVVDSIEKFVTEEDRLYQDTGRMLCLYENDALNDMVSSFICFLNSLFDDENDWIEYYMYELDFGKDWTEGCITEKDGEVVYLRDAGELYDFLLKNQESRKVYSDYKIKDHDLYADVCGACEVGEK